MLNIQTFKINYIQQIQLMVKLKDSLYINTAKRESN